MRSGEGALAGRRRRRKRKETKRKGGEREVEVELRRRMKGEKKFKRLLRRLSLSLSLHSLSFLFLFLFSKTTPRDRSHVAPLQRPLQGGRPLRPPPCPGRLGHLQVSVFVRAGSCFREKIELILIVALAARRSRRGGGREREESLAAAIVAAAAALSPCFFALLSPSCAAVCACSSLRATWKRRKQRAEAAAGHVAGIGRTKKGTIALCCFRLRPRERERMPPFLRRFAAPPLVIQVQNAPPFRPRGSPCSLSSSSSGGSGLEKPPRRLQALWRLETESNQKKKKRRPAVRPRLFSRCHWFSLSSPLSP